MPLSYLRRPVVLLTVLYVLALCFLHSRGHFDVGLPGRLWTLRFAPRFQIEGTVVTPLSENRLGERVYVRADRAMGKPFHYRVQVYLPKRGVSNHLLRPGQRVSLIGRIRPPRSARHPGDFDEERFLWNRGVGWIMLARELRILSPEPPWYWIPRAWAESVRRSIEDCFLRNLEHERARVMTGLVLGFKGYLERPTNRAIQDSGVMHLLVPSGAKVAFVLLCAEWLSLKLLRPLDGLGRLLGPLGRFVFVGAVGGFYTLMVGAEPPYTRAFLAWLALRGAMLLGREPGMFQAMMLSALVILAVAPRDLFSAGFQMTYLAVGGLVLAMPQLNRALPRRWPGWLKRLCQVFAVSVIVQVMLWPTFCAFFGRGAVIGVLANMLLVPASGLLMAAGFALWVSSVVAEAVSFAWKGAGSFALAGAGDGSLAEGAFPWASAGARVCAGEASSWVAGALACAERAFAWIASEMTGLFLKTCFWFASLPGAAVDLSPLSQVEIAVFYLLVLSVLIMPRWKASACLGICGILLWSGAGLALGARPAVEVLMLRLPKGHASLVSFPDAGHWLVDAGGPAGTVLKALQVKRVRRLEKVVLTGLGPERWRGLQRLIKEVPVGGLRVPAGTLPKGLKEALAAAQERGIPVERYSPAGLELRHGRILFEFGGESPRVRRGNAEYTIIAPRLRGTSLEVRTDGEKARIQESF